MENISIENNWLKFKNIREDNRLKILKTIVFHYQNSSTPFSVEELAKKLNLRFSVVSKKIRFFEKQNIVRSKNIKFEDIETKKKKRKCVFLTDNSDLADYLFKEYTSLKKRDRIKKFILSLPSEYRNDILRHFLEKQTSERKEKNWSENLLLEFLNNIKELYYLIEEYRCCKLAIDLKNAKTNEEKKDSYATLTVSFILKTPCSARFFFLKQDFEKNSVDNYINYKHFLENKIVENLKCCHDLTIKFLVKKREKRKELIFNFLKNYLKRIVAEEDFVIETIIKNNLFNFIFEDLTNEKEFEPLYFLP